MRFDLTHPLVRAYREHSVCVVNSFRSELAHKKAMFGFLTDDSTAKFPPPSVRPFTIMCPGPAWCRRLDYL